VLATEHDSIYADILIGENQMYHPTIMCRTDILKEIGGYWSLRRGEEWDLFLRMGERTQLANLDRVLLTYRIRAHSMTGSDLARMRNAIEYACHCADRRRDRLAAISYDKFIAQRSSAAWWQRAARALEFHARSQYQRSVEELLGDRRARGYLRLAGAALCSPYLTRRRVLKFLRKRASGGLGQHQISNVTSRAVPTPHHARNSHQTSSSQKSKVKS
jgi:hypothetical protein